MIVVDFYAGFMNIYFTVRSLLLPVQLLFNLTNRISPTIVIYLFAQYNVKSNGQV